MHPLESPAKRVIVILDPEFGERLRDLRPDTPVWIELSPTNEAVVHALWKERPGVNHLAGITGLTFQPDIDAEDRLQNELQTIDLHHGPYSAPAPFTELLVIGCVLRSDLRKALTSLGFHQFEEYEREFLAIRTTEQAGVRR